MNTIYEMVDVLRNNPKVLGLIEYGGAKHSDERIHGDYDLIVVLRQRDPEVESLHFYIGGVPVDLNIRSLADIQDIWCATEFDSVFLEGRIIYDPSNRIKQEIEALRQRHAEVLRENHNLKVAGMRHGARHILDKICDRQESMPILSSYLLHQGMYWLVPQYFQIRGLEFKGEKNALEYLQEHEPEIFQGIAEFYSTTEQNRQADLFQSVAEAVLEPVGGLWNKDEVLTFGNQKRGQKLFDTLFANNDG
jgi:hypothetical protein